MKLVITIMLMLVPATSYAECEREYPEPMALDESKLTEVERQLLKEFREIEADPVLLAQSREVAENWESYVFTECRIPEITGE